METSVVQGVLEGNGLYPRPKTGFVFARDGGRFFCMESRVEVMFWAESQPKQS